MAINTSTHFVSEISCQSESSTDILLSSYNSQDLADKKDICDRLWEKGPLGSGDQFSVYCPIIKNSFCAFKYTLKHKKLIFLTEVIAF